MKIIIIIKCFSGADSLVTKLTDKISQTSSHKLILAHLPLILVCIEVQIRLNSKSNFDQRDEMYFQGLGKLAEKFPMLAKQGSDCLREFLSTPSKLLIRLQRHYHHVQGTNRVKQDFVNPTLTKNVLFSF